MNTRLFVSTILARAINRPPTEMELSVALKAAAEVCGGERIYIAQVSPIDRHRILAFRALGWTIRQICKEVHVRPATVVDVIRDDVSRFALERKQVQG